MYTVHKALPCVGRYFKNLDSISDAKCVAAGGRCQEVTEFCCGVYKKGLCGGGTYRLCLKPCWLEGAVNTICTGRRPSFGR